MANTPKGLPRLLRQLNALPQLAVNELSEAIGQEAPNLVVAIKAAAPVGHDGVDDLRQSVGWNWGPPPWGSLSAGTLKVGDARYELKLAASIYVGDEDAFYARWVEFGTSPGVTGKTVQIGARTRVQYRTHPGSMAQPFFYPTIRIRIRAIKARLRKAGSRAAKALTTVK